jgi:CBS domain-containing protein
VIAPWAADPLSDGSIAAVEAIEGAVTVDLIATFEPQLACCAKTDAIDRLFVDFSYAQFDCLPVRFEDRIVGLLSLGELRAAPIDPLGLTAESVMHSLDPSILITPGSSVLRYIEEAEANPCRLVIRDTRIAGIVTISDLQKLAVRPALFVLVTHLELLMGAAIRAHFRERPDEGS